MVKKDRIFSPFIKMFIKVNRVGTNYYVLYIILKFVYFFDISKVFDSSFLLLFYHFIA